MTDSEKTSVQQMLDGTRRSPGVSFLLAAAACAEPFYAGIMRFRNAMYDRGILRSRPLGRPAISVGNLTVGGTGKTPVVRWIAEKLHQAGQRPAILLRGYKPTPQGFSDEAELLRGFLPEPIAVFANPDRINGAASALSAHPETSVFILDDAMQHRRAARDFELVLIHAAHPFGFDHLLPRGLLREPLAGLKRADAILITHSSEVELADLNRIEAKIRKSNANAPIFRSDHIITTLRGENNELLNSLSGKNFASFCGIGSPESFFAAIKKLGGNCVHAATLNDHHAYTADELLKIENSARQRGAELLITTEKDWVKIKRVKREDKNATRLPIYRAELSIKFWEDHEQRLLDEATRAIAGKLQV